mgnify:CR=1 FL=1
MKTYNKIVGLIAGIAILFASCSKGGDQDGLRNGKAMLLMETKVDDIMKARYEYDSENRVTKIYGYDDAGTLITTLTYTYGSNGLLNTVEMKDTGGEVQSTETFNYGDDGKPTSSFLVTGDGGVLHTTSTTYTYSTGKLVEKTNIPGGFTTENTYTFDSKGNVQAIDTSMQGFWSSTIEFGDYDDKHTAGRYGNPYAWKYNSPNNYRSQKIRTPYEAGNQDIVFIYSYNGEGYPTKMEKYNKDDNQLIETYTYSYGSAN